MCWQLFGAGNPWYPALTLADLTDLRAAGANFVNLSFPGPFGVDSMTLDVPNWIRLVEIVEWAGQADLFAVLSFREGPARGEGDITGEGNSRKTVLCTTPSEQTAYVAMWQHTAAYFMSERHVVGYDIMVEPHDMDRSDWRGFAQDIYSVPDATLFMAAQFEKLETMGINHAGWIWEVRDPMYTYRVMDIRQTPQIEELYIEAWSNNTVFPARVAFQGSEDD